MLCCILGAVFDIECIENMYMKTYADILKHVYTHTFQVYLMYYVLTLGLRIYIQNIGI